MAQRRMFSLQIVDSDAFLDMPTSSQLLYFHLSMRADDDGFVDNPKKISRMLVGGDDDLKVLIAKRFILNFDSGVIVIKHWKIHNYIQNDRYHETKYVEEKNVLVVKENGSYTECIQNGYIMDTEVRLGKASQDKKEEKIPASISYLKEIPMEDVKEFVERFEINEKGVRSKAEDLLLYCERKGKVYKNYKAFLLNAIKKDCRERVILKPQNIEKTIVTEEDKKSTRASLDKIKEGLLRDNILPPKK